MEQTASGPALTTSWLGSRPTGLLILFKFASPLTIKNLKNLLSAAAPLSLSWGAEVGSTKLGKVGARFFPSLTLIF